MDTLVKMHGVPEAVLNTLIAQGYFKTKAEVIRAGVLNLGEKYGLIPKDKLGLVALRIKKEEADLAASGKKLLSEAEVKRKYGFK